MKKGKLDRSKAEQLIPGSLKRSKSYFGEYAALTYAEIRLRADQNPPDVKARKMKKLIEQAERLKAKIKGRNR